MSFLIGKWNDTQTVLVLMEVFRYNIYISLYIIVYKYLHL